MNTISVSATYARNNFFELIEKIKNGLTVVISKDNEEVLTMIPRKFGNRLQALVSASKKVHGIIPDMKLEDSPLRQDWSWPNLGKWDK